MNDIYCMFRLFQSAVVFVLASDTRLLENTADSVNGACGTVSVFICDYVSWMFNAFCDKST